MLAVITHNNNNNDDDDDDDNDNISFVETLIYMYVHAWYMSVFCQKWLEENSPFLYFFLIHIHVFMLYFKSELIPFKIGFFTNF